MAQIKAKITSAVLTASAFLALGACKKESTTGSRESPVLRVLTWSDYLNPRVVESFEQSHKAKVKLDFFSSNEELLAKVQASVKAGGVGYDLVFPSDYMVSSLIELKLVQKIDPTKLTFLGDLDPAFQSPAFNPGLTHSIPFAWGTTGVVVNTSQIKNFKGTLSWKEFFESPSFAGKVSVLDDTKEVFHAALHALGKTWADATEDDLKLAFEYLKKHKKNIKLFTAQTKPVIEAGECSLCMVYSGDALQLASENPKLQYLIPQEGTTLWSDNLAIPVNATQVALAHEMINHLLKAENAKVFTEETFFASPNQKANALVDVALRSNKSIFPSAESMKQLRYLTDRPELLPVLDRLWTELKSL